RAVRARHLPHPVQDAADVEIGGELEAARCGECHVRPPGFPGPSRRAGGSELALADAGDIWGASSMYDRSRVRGAGFAAFLSSERAEAASPFSMSSTVCFHSSLPRKTRIVCGAS